MIGVADGVGGWAEVGVNAGEFSRELMSNSVKAIREEPEGSVDPARVLEKAHSSAKARGSSTACIITLTEKVCFIVNFTCLLMGTYQISKSINAFAFKTE